MVEKDKKLDVVYSISSKRLLIMRILTFTLYDSVLFYYIWKNFEKDYDKKIRPKLRGILSLILYIRLFLVIGLASKLEKIFEKFKEKNGKQLKDDLIKYIAILLFATIVLNNVAKIENPIILLLIPIITIAMFLFTTYFLGEANITLNDFYKKHSKKVIKIEKNRWFDIVLIIIGIIVWIVIILSILIPTLVLAGILPLEILQNIYG